MRTDDEKKLEDIYTDLRTLIPESFHGDFEGYSYKDYAKLDRDKLDRAKKNPVDREAGKSKKKDYIENTLKPKVVEYMKEKKGDGKVLHVKFDNRYKGHALVQFMSFDAEADEYKLDNEHIHDADLGEDFSKILN